MAKSSLERTIEKHQQEQKRIADNQRRMAEKQAREEKNGREMLLLMLKRRVLLGVQPGITGFV